MWMRAQTVDKPKSAVFFYSKAKNQKEKREEQMVP